MMVMVAVMTRMIVMMKVMGVVMLGDNDTGDGGAGKNTTIWRERKAIENKTHPCSSACTYISFLISLHK